MKERVVDMKYDPWGKVMRNRREAEQPRTPAAQLRTGDIATADGAGTAAPSRTVLSTAPAAPAKPSARRLNGCGGRTCTPGCTYGAAC